MTAYEILTKGFGLAGESFEDFPDKALAVIWLNITAAEALDAENAIRKTDGKQLLSAAVAVKELSAEVDMSASVCNVALPYGIAAYLFNDREDNYMAAIFRNRYITALQNRAKGEEITIQDVYGGEI